MCGVVLLLRQARVVLPGTFIQGPRGPHPIPCGVWLRGIPLIHALALLHPTGAVGLPLSPPQHHIDPPGAVSAAGTAVPRSPWAAQEGRGTLARGWHQGSLTWCRQTLPCSPQGGEAPTPWAPRGAHPHGLGAAERLPKPPAARPRGRGWGRAPVPWPRAWLLEATPVPGSRAGAQPSPSTSGSCQHLPRGSGSVRSLPAPGTAPLSALCPHVVPALGTPRCMGRAGWVPVGMPPAVLGVPRVRASPCAPRMPGKQRASGGED